MKNNEWFLSAAIWFAGGVLAVSNSNWQAALASTVAVFMCLICRAKCNECDKLKDNKHG